LAKKLPEPTSLEKHQKVKQRRKNMVRDFKKRTKEWQQRKMEFTANLRNKSEKLGEGRLSNSKAAGQHEILAEYIEYRGEATCQKLCNIFYRIFESHLIDNTSMR
jgi:hypothetical protein